MLNLGTCPAAKHLVLRSLLSGVLRRSAERRWKEMRRFDGRGRRVVVGSFAGHGGDGRPSDLALQAAAVRAASIRFLESHRPDPLLIDPYAGCFLSNGMAVEDETKVEYPMSGPSSSPCHYTLATKFIDDKLLSLVSGIDEVKQMALTHDPTGSSGLPEPSYLTFPQKMFSGWHSRSLSMWELKLQKPASMFIYLWSPMIYKHLYAMTVLMVAGEVSG
uniref:Putative S-adenosyl-L-methionine-dependent methyltransferase MSMEG_1480 n=1 Tax=Anthurium amnicola TaxID=1678845 RepID=A0A1D1YUC1_9ARAE